MKKVNLIIPFYNRTEAQLAIVLSSINNQIGVDFSQLDVHLVNDGGKKIDISKFEIFKNLELYLHELPENRGAGVARQYGIDVTDGEYFMFLDSDDQFHFAGALLEFFNVVKYHGEHQLIIASYLEEYQVMGGEYRYLTHDCYDWKSPVAKWFNRKYIESEGLRFQDELRIFEDTYFVGLSCQHATDIYYLNSVVYTWMCNPESTVRANGRSFEYQTHTWALENRLYLEKIKEKRPELIESTLENYVTDCYMRYKTFPPVDEAAFWQEHKKILVAFAPYWHGYTKELQEKVDALSQAPSKWAKTSTKDFERWVNKSH